MRVGSLVVDPPVLLAPMSEVSDLSLRTLCEEHGAGLTVTEFLSANALAAGAERMICKMTASAEGRPFAVQIFGREDEVMADAARMAASQGAALVDINMGCPARRIVRGECGSALMREPDLAARLVRAVRAAVPDSIPVSVKHRSGWDETHLNAPEFAVAMVEAGAAMITVHGRTRTQGYRGRASRQIIRAVREAVPSTVPVVGNGDVLTPDDYFSMRDETGCDAVMIGRGALGNPWLFRSIAARLRGLDDPGPPSTEERLGALRRHLELAESCTAPHRLIHEFRKVCAWYTKGNPGCAAFRARTYHMTDATEIVDLAESFFQDLLSRPR